MYSVLLVEDDPTIRFIYKKMKEWKMLGFEIEKEVEHGKSALEALSERNYDLVFTDIRMPIMTGIELLEKMTEKNYDNYVVIASNHEDFEYVRQGLRFGVTDYLLKPVQHSELEKCLAHIRDKLDESGGKSRVYELLKACGLDITQQFVRNLADYYGKNLDKEGMLYELAEYFELSKDYFSKMFKSKTGINYNQFATQYKMEQAKYLLLNENYKIYEISELLGYKTVDYFSKIFKEYTTMTPIQFRNIGM
jgi:YesN/AraC family two-component response regulator